MACTAAASPRLMQITEAQPPSFLLLKPEFQSGRWAPLGELRVGYVGLHVRPCRDAFLWVSSRRDMLQRDQVYMCAWRAGTCDPKRQVGSASHGGSREACSLGSLLSRSWSLHHTGKEAALQAPPVAHTGLVSGARSKAISFGGGKHQEDVCHFLPGDRPRTRQQQGPGAGCGPVAVAAGKWGPQEGVAQPQAAPGPWAPRASSPGRLRTLGQVLRPGSLHLIPLLLSLRRAPPR